MILNPNNTPILDIEEFTKQYANHDYSIYFDTSGRYAVKVSEYNNSSLSVEDYGNVSASSEILDFSTTPPTIVNSKGEIMKDMTEECVSSSNNPFE